MQFQKKIVSVFIVSILLLFPHFSSSQNADWQYWIERAQKDINRKGDFYAGMYEKDIANYRNELLRILSVDYLSNDSVFAYCNKEALDFFIEKEIPFKILRSPGEVDFDLNMKTWVDLLNKDLIDNWDFYPTYEAYESLMLQFETDFPELCKVYNVVTLPSNRSIYFAKISSNVHERQAEPRFMYTATMHGDETAGFILSLRLIHYLLTNYGIKEEITWLLDNMEIWISPNENPDGTYTNNNSTVSGATRTNANGVDLNRNYPNPVNNPTSPIQPETQAMMNLTDTLHFVMSANMHGGIECINYPWDSWTSNVNIHADHYWWQLVSHEYADTARFHSPPNYMNPSGPSFNNGVTHGGDWYVIYGSRQDYMNYYTNQRELTLELSNIKILPPDQLPAHWEYNYRSFLNYIRQANYGFRGIVTDMYSGEPLVAKIELLDHDIDNSHVYSELPHGDFYRPVLAGTYTLKVTADGYNPLILENITIDNYQTIALDIQLIGDNPYAPPTNLVAHTGNNSQVYLEWDAPQSEKSGEKISAKDYSFFEPDAYYIYRNGEFLDETEDTHFFDVDIPLGTWEYYVKAWYADPEGLSHPSNTVSVTFSDSDLFTVTFQITDENDLSVDDAFVNLGGQDNEQGDYIFEYMEPGIYDYMVWGDNYLPFEGTLEVVDADIVEDVVLLIDDTSIADLSQAENISIFPNPASDNLNIVSEFLMKEIRLTDIKGRLIMHYPIMQKEFAQDISFLAPGIYIIGIYTGEGVSFQKLQKQ